MELDDEYISFFTKNNKTLDIFKIWIIIMNEDKAINLFDIDRTDFTKLPDGANYIIDNDMKPVAVVMSIKYYRYLEHLMFKLKDKIVSVNKER